MCTTRGLFEPQSPPDVKEKRSAYMANKIDELTDQAADVAASIIAAPFKFTGEVLGKLFWWV